MKLVPLNRSMVEPGWPIDAPIYNRSGREAVAQGHVFADWSAIDILVLVGSQTLESMGSSRSAAKSQAVILPSGGEPQSSASPVSSSVPDSILRPAAKPPLATVVEIRPGAASETPVGAPPRLDAAHQVDAEPLPTVVSVLIEGVGEPVEDDGASIDDLVERSTKSVFASIDPPDQGFDAQELIDRVALSGVTAPLIQAIERRSRRANAERADDEGVREAIQRARSQSKNQPQPRMADNAARLESRAVYNARQILAGQSAEPVMDDYALLDAMVDQDRDEAIFYLRHTVHESQFKNYSNHHAVCVAALSDLVAQAIWTHDEQERARLMCAAMTANLGMIDQHNRLVLSDEVSADDRIVIKSHPARSASLLKGCGVDDLTWIKAVLFHHARIDQEFGDITDSGLKAAMIIGAVDRFWTRHTPRAYRKAMTARMAAGKTLVDEAGNADILGAAIVKAVGLYPPRSFIRLESGEVAVILRRGPTVNTPVAVIMMGADGFVNTKYPFVDYARPQHKIRDALRVSDVRIRLNMDLIRRRIMESKIESMVV